MNEDRIVRRIMITPTAMSSAITINKTKLVSVSVTFYNEFEFWCLTPLSAIFQLYHGDQF
jgi:hypothetical protein